MTRNVIHFNNHITLPARRGISEDIYRDGYLKYIIAHVDVFTPDDPQFYYWYITDRDGTVFCSGYAITKSECVDLIRYHANQIKAYYRAHPSEIPT